MRISLADFTASEEEDILGKVVIIYVHRRDRTEGLHMFIEDRVNE